MRGRSVRRTTTLPALGLATVLGLGAPAILPAEDREANEREPPEAESRDAAGTESEPLEAERPAQDPRQPALTERVVVSASATDRTVLDAPAAVDVLDGAKLEQRPADLLVDQLRRVPGINVVQFSARDVNIASRSATGGINNSTLALTDGRTLYQDFLGFVMWEFAPTDLSLVDRIEVVRGPASSLWGANAVGGLVHVLTRSPRDTLGGRAKLEGGNYDTGNLEFRESFLAGPWALRVSGGYRTADAFRRPQTVENFFGETIDPDLGLIGGGFDDSGTRQPRLDVRADWEAASGGEWILQGGWGRTRGWIATGLGPFDIDSGTSSSYVQARYAHGPYEAQFVADYFDGDALNLISALPFDFTAGTSEASFRGRHLLGRRGVVGWGAELERSTYDLSIAPGGEARSTASALAELDLELTSKLLLAAGARLDHVEETIGSVLSPRAALRYKPRPDQTLRIAWGRAFRSPSVIESDLFVPAIPVAILDWQEVDRQLFEAGILDPDVFTDGFFSLMVGFVCASRPDNCGADPGTIPSYTAVTAASGSRELREETTESIELGYALQLGRFGLSAALYRTKTRNGIDFPLVQRYGVGSDATPLTDDDVVLPADPQGDGIEELPADVNFCVLPGAELIPPFDALCAPQLGVFPVIPFNQAVSTLLDGQVPARFRYDNRSDAKNRGLELGLSWDGPGGVSSFLNYSWQDDPEAGGVDMRDRIDVVREETAAERDLDGDGKVADTSDFVNVPAAHRVSLGVQLDRGRWFSAFNYDYVDDTFWQDVLTPQFWGWIDGYSLVGLRGGRRWPATGLELTAQVTNLLDEEVQQHIYGDIIDRRFLVSAAWTWERGKGLSREPDSR